MGGRGWTGEAELDDLLQEIVATSRSVFGSAFVGAYLQGSFALGDADRASDCDFLVVVSSPANPHQERAIRSMHRDIPSRPGHWSHHLEGSYAVASELRALSGLGCAWLYVDHGASEMELSTHCNSEVTRWILREHGVTLAGPTPDSLVEPVPAAAIRATMRRYAADFPENFASWMSVEIGWGQRYAVATMCRILYSIQTGEVASKSASLRWAAENLEPRWRPLLGQVLADRAPFDLDERTAPADAALAHAFVDRAVALAAQM